MEKPTDIEDLDRRIRIVREVSQQPTLVLDEHLSDLLQQNHQKAPINTDEMRSRFQDHITVSRQQLIHINWLNAALYYL